MARPRRPALRAAVPLLGLLHPWGAAPAAAGDPSLLHRLDATDGWFVAGGGLLSLSRHLRLDLQGRHSQTDAVAGRAYLRRNHHRTGAFPMRREAQPSSRRPRRSFSRCSGVSGSRDSAALRPSAFGGLAR